MLNSSLEDGVGGQLVEIAEFGFDGTDILNHLLITIDLRKPGDWDTSQENILRSDYATSYIFHTRIRRTYDEIRQGLFGENIGFESVFDEQEFDSILKFFDYCRELPPKVILENQDLGCLQCQILDMQPRSVSQQSRAHAVSCLKSIFFGTHLNSLRVVIESESGTKDQKGGSLARGTKLSPRRRTYMRYSCYANS